MSAREWTLPVLLGLLAAGAVFLVPDVGLPARDALPDGATKEPLGLAWAVRETVAPPGEAAVLLGVGIPDQRNLEVQCLDGTQVLPLEAESSVLWRVAVPSGCQSLDGVLQVGSAPVEARRFGLDGHNATSVTLYVFDAEGQLVASSAGATDRNRYRLYGDFVTVSQRPWYLGDGAVPEGMRVPEGYVAFARERLLGVPEGGTAWVAMWAHEYDWLTGPLWVTARIDTVLASA